MALTAQAYNSGIYEIKCLANEKIYIGKAKIIEKRFNQHLYHLKNGSHFNRELQKDFNNFGEAQFIFTIVLQCSEKELNQKEQFFIKSLIKDGKVLYNSFRKKKQQQKNAIEKSFNNQDRIFQFNSEGDLIKIWESLEEIANEFADELNFIVLNLKKEILVNKDFIWSYRKIDNIEQFIKPQVCSNLIFEYDENKELLRIWKNIAAWRRFYNVYCVNVYNYVNANISLQDKYFFSSKQEFSKTVAAVKETSKPLTTSQKIRKFLIEFLGGQLA